VTRSPQHFGEVAGEYAQAIRDHMPEIVGIVAGFLMAEATSAFLAATPTGVGQIAATVIQLGLSAFGAAGAIQAGAEALKHAGEWLTIAWTAQGKDDRIAAASKEFLKMLVGIAMAALSALGARANYGNALKIASSMPTGGLPAMAMAGGGQIGGGARAGAGVLINPGTGSLGTAGNAMMQADDKNGGGRNDGGTKSTDPAKELEEVKQKLESDDLTGKQKQALRARKKELQEQLGKSTSEPISDEAVATSESSAGKAEEGKAIGKGSKVDLDALHNRPAQELISGSLKKSPSYATELAERTVGELLELQKAGGPEGVKAGKMLKLIKDAERLRGKVK
jgi:hypothetical protein